MPPYCIATLSIPLAVGSQFSLSHHSNYGLQVEQMHFCVLGLLPNLLEVSPNLIINVH